jgi:hypothetical protein
VASSSEPLVALLQKAWRREWYGVRVYGELAARPQYSQEAATMLELVVLESYVLGELTVALLALGIEPDLDGVEADAETDLATHAQDEWAALVAWIKSDAESALDDYRDLPDLAGDGLAGVADLVVAHEQALVTFASKTLAGRGGVLDEVRALVRVGG